MIVRACRKEDEIQRSRSRAKFSERLSTYVDADACWEWRGCENERGYVRVKFASSPPQHRRER